MHTVLGGQDGKTGVMPGSDAPHPRAVAQTKSPGNSQPAASGLAAPD